MRAKYLYIIILPLVISCSMLIPSKPDQEKKTPIDESVIEETSTAIIPPATPTISSAETMIPSVIVTQAYTGTFVDEHGVEMVWIPAGEFQMGCDPDHNGGFDCPSNELPLHTVYLDTYSIEKYEVTNDQMAAFLNSRGSNVCDGTECVDLDHSDLRISYTGGQYVVDSGYNDHPIVEVTWYGADAFCTENDKRLPTEAEWEKAARGTTVRAYPWGDSSPTCALANFYDGSYCVGGTAPVGSYPSGASPYGVLDMAGNVFEWVNDWWSGNYYEECETGCSNPTGPVDGDYKVLRGGGWGHPDLYLRTTNRHHGAPHLHEPDYSSSDLGFRCAGIPSNQNPNTPSNPSPTDGATNQSQNVDLSWTGGDPDGDTVTYDVYFEADDTSPDLLVSNDQSGTIFDPGTLTASTHYYWQIIAQDQHGATTNGPVWDFTTGSGGVIPGDMVSIPAGNFQMGCDPYHNGGHSCDYDELPLHQVYLDAYYIDKYEVTNDQMAAFLNSRGSNDCDGTECVDLDSSYLRISYTGGQYLVDSGYGDHPVVEVTWYGANAFCTENGKRLPTEAEWEKAARGTTVRAYPWGDSSPTCALANFDYCVGDTAPVGSYPSGASPYGVLDMAGNVWEWVADWYLSSYYQSCETGCSNPTGPVDGNCKVLRGGGWYYYDGSLRAAGRDGTYPGISYGNNNYGFRCVGSAPPGP
jgi:formylglycine-generating enzyme required for sulfatase activity